MVDKKIYEQYLALQKEIAYAKRFAKYHGPEDMGYVHTSIDWLEYRRDQVFRRLKRLKSKYVTYQRLQKSV